MEEVHHRRSADDRIVEDSGHVEPDHAFVEVDTILDIIEQPGAFAAAPPGRKARGEVTGVRARIAAQQLCKMS